MVLRKKLPLRMGFRWRSRVLLWYAIRRLVGMHVNGRWELILASSRSAQQKTCSN